MGKRGGGGRGGEREREREKSKNVQYTVRILRCIIMFWVNVIVRW